MANHPDERRNFVGGSWRVPTGSNTNDVWDPATGVVIARVRSSSAGDVAEAAAAAAKAASEWRRLPANERAQWLFGFFTQTKVVVERWP